MKLSELLRVGSEGAIQIRGQCANGQGGYCALGAIGKAFGLSYEDNHTVGVIFRVPGMRSFIDHNGRRTTVGDVIFHLNDDNRMSFKDIQEWLEERGL